MSEELDFVKLVENPTWKDILMGLVHREEIDPWDIDLEKITTKYLEVVRNMKKVDLYIPANIILAASILLRFKSERVGFVEEVEEDWVEDEFAPDMGFEGEFTDRDAIPHLVFRPRFPKKRKVTLEELVKAVDDALKQETKREAYRKERVNYAKEIEKLEVEEIDVEEIIRGVYARVIERIDEYGIARFSDIAGKEPIEKIRDLLALLYLATSDYLEVFQEELYSEIYVRINKERLVKPEEISMKIVI